MKVETSRKIKDNVILILWVIILAAVFSFLFNRQAIAYNESYLSDFQTEIGTALGGGTLSLLDLMIRSVFSATGNSLYCVALMEGFMVSLTWAAASLFLEKYFRYSRWAAMLVSLALLFVTNIPAPFFGRYYAGSIIAQPWHNISYSAMRLFAVCAMFFWGELYRIFNEEKRIDWKNWILTCLMIFFATLMKPGFVMAFGAGLLIILLAALIRKGNKISNIVLLGCMVLPSLVLLIIQYVHLKHLDSAYGIRIAASIFFFQENPRAFVMKFITGLFLAVLVLWYNRKNLRKDMAFVYICYGTGLLEAMFLMESGDRATLGSFLWGMQVFAYFLYLFMAPVFIGNFRDYLKGRDKEKPALWKTGCIFLGTVLLVLHVFIGLRYYSALLRGVSYYI